MTVNMNLETIIIAVFVIAIIGAFLINDKQEYKGDLDINVKTTDTNDNIINKSTDTYKQIDNTEINKTYEESRLETNCDKILNKVESTKEDIKHTWEERAKRLQC